MRGLKSYQIIFFDFKFSNIILTINDFIDKPMYLFVKI